MPMRLWLKLKYIVLIEFSQIVSRLNAGRWAAKHSPALRLKPCTLRLYNLVLNGRSELHGFAGEGGFRFQRSGFSFYVSFS